VVGHGERSGCGALRARFDPSFRWARANNEWTLGTKGQGRMATFRAFDRFTLTDVADRMEADVLILAGAQDHPIPLSQVACFEKALTRARSVTTHVYNRPLALSLVPSGRVSPGAASFIVPTRNAT